MMINRASPSGTRELIQRYGLYPKKRLGQNFLMDRNILTKIADSCAINPEQYLIEIGPGLGGLTQELAARSRGVLAIEIDTSLEPALKELTNEHENIRLVFKDILKVDVEAELQKAFNLAEILPYQVCANIPYNITTPILFRLLENCPNMQSATLMMQKEVSERLLAHPGTKQYGRLTLTTAYYADVHHVMNVSRNCFYPSPDVDSAVLRIVPQKPKNVLIHQEEVFRNLVRLAFQKRRKTILNISTDFFQQDKVTVGKKLEELGLAANLRPENLSIQDVARLVNAFAPEELGSK
jgi:16S rRNA (adenine1518-N6/adenine1519-N6)-dimethyltransferase